MSHRRNPFETIGPHRADPVRAARRRSRRSWFARIALSYASTATASASLILCENADPGVRRDLETAMARLAPDGDPANVRDSEGADDMPAHLRSVLTSHALTIPCARGRLLLGTWQGFFLWEHRLAPHTRTVAVTVHGGQ